MKRLLFLPLALALFASCKEQGPAIDFGPAPHDTDYMAPVPAAQPRVVMVEEFTGVSCPNCPDGHVILKSVEDANPGRVASIGIQLFNNNQSIPVDRPDAKTRHDNRTHVGTDLGDGIYGSVLSLPCAGIDRTGTGIAMQQERAAWPKSVGDRLNVPTKANITLTSSYDASSRKVTIDVKVAYTDNISVGQLLNVAIVENNIVDAQEESTTEHQDYTHQHVLRDILTAPTGTAILTGKAIVPGKVYERVFVYTLSGDWNPDNCKIVAYVSNDNGADKEVQQAAQVSVK